MANAIIPNFIVKRISEKVGFMIMFRDGTGDVYILTNVSKELHNDPVKVLPTLNLKPSYRAGITEDGLFVMQSLTDLSSKGDILSEKITNMISKRETTMLNEGFLSPDVLLGIELHNVIKLQKDRDASLPELTLDQLKHHAKRSLTDKILIEKKEFCESNGYVMDSKNARINLANKFKMSLESSDVVSLPTPK
jgi:hypothetical protein